MFYWLKISTIFGCKFNGYCISELYNNLYLCCIVRTSLHFLNRKKLHVVCHCLFECLCVNILPFTFASPLYMGKESILEINVIITITQLNVGQRIIILQSMQEDSLSNLLKYKMHVRILYQYHTANKCRSE